MGLPLPPAAPDNSRVHGLGYTDAIGCARVHADCEEAAAAEPGSSWPRPDTVPRYDIISLFGYGSSSGTLVMTHLQWLVPVGGATLIAWCRQGEER